MPLTVIYENIAGQPLSENGVHNLIKNDPSVEYFKIFYDGHNILKKEYYQSKRLSSIQIYITPEQQHTDIFPINQSNYLCVPMEIIETSHYLDYTVIRYDSYDENNVFDGGYLEVRLTSGADIFRGFYDEKHMFTEAIKTHNAVIIDYDDQGRIKHVEENSGQTVWEPVQSLKWFLEQYPYYADGKPFPNVKSSEVGYNSPIWQSEIK